MKDSKRFSPNHPQDPGFSDSKHAAHTVGAATFPVVQQLILLVKQLILVVHGLYAPL